MDLLCMAQIALWTDSLITEMLAVSPDVFELLYRATASAAFLW